MAVANNAAVNVGAQLSALVAVFDPFGCTPWSGFTGSNGNSVSVFEEPPHRFPQQLYHFTLPSAKHKGSNLAKSSPTLVIFRLLYHGRYNAFGVESYCDQKVSFEYAKSEGPTRHLS